MARPTAIDRGLLEIALIGYETEKARIEAAIADIRAQLNGRDPDGETLPQAGGTTRKKFSAATRRKMAEAQRKRWASAWGNAVEAQKPKRKLSAAGRKAIVDAARRRWAALRKAKAAAE
jgi:hypothetical protein